LKRSKEDAQKLREQAERLRQEIDEFEQTKLEKERQEESLRRKEQAAKQERRDRYSAVVPILKPDGSTQREQCDFVPRHEEGSSSILTVEARLPLGILLGESDEFAGTVTVDEVAQGSNGEIAGIRQGDLLRACTACKMEMEQPTWQLIAGGIGQPKTVRFMYSVDNRPFEEVMDAVASNRMDPGERPMLLVLERRDS
jgi:hypothetical protein